MPTLHEVQRAFFRSLVTRDDGEACQYIVADEVSPEARFSIYRNTFVGVLTTALRLSFPAVCRLVGEAFFETASRLFIEEEPPRSAWLDQYGAAFADFLARFAPAATLPYLPGVARLEWAVSHALHAVDAEPLALSRLAEIDPADQPGIAFVPQPSLGFVRADHPVDAIWRTVLSGDDDAMAAVDLRSGPVWLLVERRAAEVELARLTEPAWRFTAALCASQALQSVIDAAPEVDASVLLANHLSAGRFIDFRRVGT
jgi:hypothetical protein